MDNWFLVKRQITLQVLQPIFVRSLMFFLRWWFYSIAHVDEEKGHKVFRARFVDEISHVGNPQA